MTFCAANVFRYFVKLGLHRKQWSKECQAAYQETGWMVWNDKRPQGSGVSIDYHQRSSHNRCSQFTKPVRASNNNAGAWRGKTPSHFWFISFGHLANNSARSLFCEPIRIQGKNIHVAGSRRGKWVREGHHWFALTNQKTGSQFREPIRTRCKDILLVPSAGKCRRVVVGWKSLSGANFF